MNEIQKQNVENIIRMAKKLIAASKKNADVGEAIGIANREAQIDCRFRTLGIEPDDLSANCQPRKPPPAL